MTVGLAIVARDLTQRLPCGGYFAYSRATNAAGVTQRRFTRANRRAFRVG